jgi:endonuclease/exonuclease/phosphatase family metal-dependent hydrolase
MMNHIRFVGIICVLAITTVWTQFTSGVSSSAPPADHFSVLTYNVYTVLGAPGILDRLDLIAQTDVLVGHDVVILTELFHDEGSVQLLEAMSAEYPYQTPVLGRGNRVDPDCAENDCWNSSEGQISESQPEDGGVAILSRWPILERRQYVYGSRCGIDALSRKGFVYVDIDIDGAIVHIIGTHIQSDPTLDNAFGSQLERLFACPEPETVHESADCPAIWQSAQEAVRINQLAEIDAWIAQQAIPRDHTIIIGGDLNVDKEGSPAEYEHMLCMLKVSVPIYGGDPVLEPPWYTYDGMLNKLLSSDVGQFYLDYVFVRDGHAQSLQLQNVVLRPTAFPFNWDDGSTRGYELSDHFPVAGFFANSDSPGWGNH